MDKSTLELLHSKLSDLDSKIAEISSLRQEIFNILKEHESKQQAAADAAALVAQAKATQTKDEEASSDKDTQDLDLAQIKTKVDEAVQEDMDEDDNDALDSIDDIDSPQDVETDAEKAKKDIEREAIALEAEKLMHSPADDVEPMRDAEESLEDDINGGNEEDANNIDMVNNPETISTTDPTIIPAKVLDEDLDVGKDSDLVKVNDAFAEMDRIESQENIDKMEEELSKEHDHHDLVADKESEAETESAREEAPAEVEEAKNEALAVEEAKDEAPIEEEVEEEVTINDQLQPEVEEEEVEKEATAKPETKVEETKVEETPKTAPVAEQKPSQAKGIEEVKDTFVAQQPATPKPVETKVEEEEAVFVQPKPIQQTTPQPTHPSNQGTLNAGRHSAGLKVDEMLSRQNSRNLYKAFTLNDKFRFRRELFHGKDVEMAEALDRISMMDNYNQAEDYFFETLGLNPNNEDVKDFMMIIQNHFA